MGCGASKSLPLPDTSSVDRVKQWSTIEVGAWISHVFRGAPVEKEITGKFTAAAIDGGMLVTLSDEDLKDDLGIDNKMHRKKIVAKLAEIKNDNGSPEPSPAPTAGKHMSSVVPASDQDSAKPAHVSGLANAAQVLKQTNDAAPQPASTDKKDDSYNLPDKSTPSKTSIATKPKIDWNDRSAIEERRKKRQTMEKAKRDAELKAAQDKAREEAQKKLADLKLQQEAAEKEEQRKKAELEEAERKRQELVAQKEAEAVAAAKKLKEEQAAAAAKKLKEEQAAAAAALKVKEETPKRRSVGFAEPAKDESSSKPKISKEDRDKRSSKADWGEFMKQTTMRTQEVNNTLERMKTEGSFWNDDVLEEEMAKEKEKTQQNKHIMRVLQILWERYDDDGNGELDRDECKDLFREYLENNKPHVKAMIEDAINKQLDQQMKELIELTAKQGARLTQEEIDDMTEDMMEPMDKIKVIVIRRANKFIDGILNSAEEMDTKAGELMESMDEDGNGLIDKEEFMGGFFESMTTVLDMTEFTTEAKEMMENWEDFDSDEYNSDDDE